MAILAIRGQGHRCRWEPDARRSTDAAGGHLPAYVLQRGGSPHVAALPLELERHRRNHDWFSARRRRPPLLLVVTHLAVEVHVVSTGPELQSFVREIRTLCEQVASLLGTADRFLGDHGWTRATSQDIATANM